MKLRMLKRVVLVPAIAGLAAIASAVSLAHPGGGFSGADNQIFPKKQIMKMMRQLDLSMEQKMAVRSTLRGMRDDLSVVKQDLQKMRSEMFKLLESGNVSQQSIDALLEQYEGSLRAMSKAGASTRNAIYTVLTDEQREKAKDLMEKRQARLEARVFEEGYPEARLNKVAKKLDFSDEQLTAATELLPVVVEARTALRDTLKSYRQSQRDLIVSNSLNDEQLDELFDVHFPEFKTNLLAAIQAHQQLFQLLTEEQKAKVKEKSGNMFLPRMI